MLQDGLTLVQNLGIVRSYNKRAAWSGGPLSTTHRYESQQGFSCGPVPVVPPCLDFAIGDLKHSDNRQIKWLDGVGLVPEVLDSLRYDGGRRHSRYKRLQAQMSQPFVSDLV